MKFFLNRASKTATLFVAVAFFAFAPQAMAQEDEPEPIKWTLAARLQSAKLIKDAEFTAVLTAKIEQGWHLYALEKTDGGPIPTRIWLADDQPFALGEIVAPKPIETDDAAFGAVTKFYEDAAEFKLPLRVTADATSGARLEIKVRYQICNDEICLPPKSVLVAADL